MIEFGPILQFIQHSRQKALATTNYYMLQVYWQVGGYIHHKLADGSWGEKVVDHLALWLKEREPTLKGFDRRRLYLMSTFYGTWKQIELDENLTKLTDSFLIENQSDIIVPTVSAQFQLTPFTIVSNLQAPILPMPSILSSISWSHHLELLSKTKFPEEKVFYLLLTVKESYTIRELRRQIDSGLFERHMLSNKKRRPINHPEALKIQQLFRDTYITEFLDLPEPHSEKELQKALSKQMKNFILELGSDFLFVAEEFKLQVGMRDYSIDLLFYHRDLRCLVDFELKIEEFKPEHLGKLNFYLEALDRDVKKPSENPSIGVLLCKTRNAEVVEYAMNRNMSPALVAEYQTRLPDKRILQKKMQELLSHCEPPSW